MGGGSVGNVRPSTFVLQQRNINVLEKGLTGDAADAFGSLDEIVAGAAGLFAAKDIGEDEGFSELTGTHQETGAINIPIALQIHESILSSRFFGPAGGQHF